MIVKSKKDIVTSCIESDLEILNNFTSRLNLIDDSTILSDPNSLDLPFGSYRSDWTRLNILHDKLPENSLLQGKLKKLFRLLAIAYLEVEKQPGRQNEFEIKNSSFPNDNPLEITGLKFPVNFTESTIIYPDANETNVINVTNNSEELLLNEKNSSIDFELSIDDKTDDDEGHFVTQSMDLIDNNTEIKMQQKMSSNVEKLDSDHIASTFSRLNQTEKKENILLHPINSNNLSTEKNFNFSYSLIFSGTKEKKKNWEYYNSSTIVVLNVSNNNVPLNLKIPTERTTKNYFYNTTFNNPLITPENNNNQGVEKIKIDTDRKPTTESTLEIIFDIPTLIYSTTENILNIKNDCESKKNNETIDDYSPTLTSEKFTTSTEKNIIINNETEKFHVGMIKERNGTLRKNLLRLNFINKNISEEINKSQLDRGNLNNKLINLTDEDIKNKLKNEENYVEKKFINSPGFNYLQNSTVKIFASHDRQSTINKNFMRYLIPMDFLKSRIRENANKRKKWQLNNFKNQKLLAEEKYKIAENHNENYFSHGSQISTRAVSGYLNTFSTTPITTTEKQDGEFR